jgi:lysine 2,3-aminomutase
MGGHMKKMSHVKQESLPELVSPYLRTLIEKTGGLDGPIGKQFVMQESQHAWSSNAYDNDPLDEDEHEVAPGLVYKYRGTFSTNGTVQTYGRALFTITRFCSSYCRFCTRGREVGLPTIKNKTNGPTLVQKPFLSDDDIKKSLSYLATHKEINEVIISGGDALISPKEYLTKIIHGLVSLQKKNQIQIIRIGTRLPIVNPQLIKDWHYDLIKTIKNPYLMVHINHPYELTKESRAVLQQFREQCFATIMSQTVLLKGVNDNPETLIGLFNLLAANAIRPYYVFQCDPVPWAKQFIVSPKKVIELWKHVRPQLSGVAATARFVIDVPHGYGKIPLPEGDAWNVDHTGYRDFKKKKFEF